MFRRVFKEKLKPQTHKPQSNKSDIQFLEPLSDDPMQRKPDLLLAKKIINWTFDTELDKGINSTIKFFREKLNS